MAFLANVLFLLLTGDTVSSETNCFNEPCLNGGECIETSTGPTCYCEDGFYGLLCEQVGYAYSFTRIISVERSLMTSYGYTASSVTLQTNVRYWTSYTKPSFTQNTLSQPQEFDCLCTRYGSYSDIEKIDPEALTNRIHESLALKKELLIKNILRYRSSSDDRPSAKGIGGVGCIVIIVTVLLIAVPDLFTLLKYLFCFQRKWVVEKANLTKGKQKKN